MERKAILRVLLPVGFTLAIGVAAMVSSGNMTYYLATPMERIGIDVWRRENCVACHAVYGLGGHIAPDLTNVWRRRGAQHIKQVLRNGGASMPVLNLDDHEIEALSRYLQHIDQLGQYPLPALNSPPFGLNGK